MTDEVKLYQVKVGGSAALHAPGAGSMSRVTDEQLAILQTCPFLYDNVSIADAADDLRDARRERWA